MDTEDYVAMHQTEPREAAARPIQGPFAALQRLLNTASFVSVDLTDTMFVSLHEEREKARRLNCSE